MASVSRRRIIARRTVAAVVVCAAIGTAAFALDRLSSPFRPTRVVFGPRPKSLVVQGVRHDTRTSVLRLPSALPQRTVRLPILMYHRIDRLTQGLPPITRALTVTPAGFAAQMEWLHRHRFHAVTQLQLFDSLEHGSALPPKPVLITFDDGYRDVLWHAAGVLARLHMAATAYVITGRISGADPSFLTWPELRRLERSGVELGSHTVHHLELPLLSDHAALTELRQSRAVLERHLGHPVQWFAYPAGAETAHAATLVAKAGYVLAVTTAPGQEQQAADPLALHRYEVQDTTGVAGVAAIVGR